MVGRRVPHEHGRLKAWGRTCRRVTPVAGRALTVAVKYRIRLIRSFGSSRVHSGHFPNDDAALRSIWLAIQRAKNSWRSCYNWTNAMAVLRIHFGDRIPDNT